MTKPYSPSKLDHYEFCEKKGRYYEQKDETEPSELRDIGSIVHKLLHAQSEQRPAPDLSAYPAQYIIQATEIAARVAVRIKTEGAEQYFEHGLAVDQNWKPCSWDSPNAYLRGVLDVVAIEEQLINGEYYGLVCEVQDYKSGWADPNPKGIQALAYLVLAAAHWPDVELVTVRFQKIRTGLILENKINLADEPDRLEQYRQIVVDKINRAEASEGRALVGGACLLCVHRAECKEYQQSAVSKSIPADPHELGRLYLSSVARTKELEKALRVSVDVIGNMELDGYELGFMEANRTELKFPALLEAWQKAGGDLAGFVKILDRPGVKAVEPIIAVLAEKNGEKFYETRAKFVSVKPGRKWGHRKQKVEGDEDGDETE